MPYYLRRLREELANRQSQNSAYSLRSFARSLDLSSGAVSQLLSGKRIPSGRTVKRLLAGLSLRTNEMEQFLTSLESTHKARSLRRQRRIVVALSDGENRGKAGRENSWATRISLDRFRVIADWYHYAILELTFVDGFRDDCGWIASQIGVHPNEARLALERLETLGLLSRDEKGGLQKTSAQLLTSDRELTTAAHRRHQKQILEKSILSLEGTPIAKRNHTSMTMAIDPDLIPEAKKRIEKFTRSLCEFLESGKRKQVYELALSLFPVSKENEK